jgi:hypothetical protein
MSGAGAFMILLSGMVFRCCVTVVVWLVRMLLVMDSGVGFIWVGGSVLLVWSWKRVGFLFLGGMVCVVSLLSG